MLLFLRMGELSGRWRSVDRQRLRRRTVMLSTSTSAPQLLESEQSDGGAMGGD
jgi:hypothetical protein